MSDYRPHNRRLPKAFRFKQDAKHRVIIAFIFLFIIACGLFGVYWFQANHLDYGSIDKIKSVQKGPNKFFDLANEVDVSGIDDINYSIMKNGNFEIHYGKQVIAIPKKYVDTKDKELYQRLNEIGIKIQSKQVIDEETGKEKTQYRVLYWGEPVRYVVQRG